MSHRTNDMNWAEMSMEDVLLFAIEDENEAQKYYRHASTLTGNTHTRDVLLRLAEMERGHAEVLRQELEELRLEREEETGMAD
jgi:rubrerythrin